MGVEKVWGEDGKIERERERRGRIDEPGQLRSLPAVSHDGIRRPATCTV